MQDLVTNTQGETRMQSSIGWGFLTLGIVVQVTFMLISFANLLPSSAPFGAVHVVVGVLLAMALGGLLVWRAENETYQ